MIKFEFLNSSEKFTVKKFTVVFNIRANSLDIE